MKELDAKEIARQSRSNLTIALAALPPDRRDDMITFYAFCRVVDDIADEPGRPAAEKLAGLEIWRKSASRNFSEGGWLHADLARIVERYSIPSDLFLEIIDGVSMDIDPQPFRTYDDLLGYCYKVASAVGLVSVRIFGCKSEGSDDYAINLGYALQITNIMRDVREDLENDGRIYLPTEVMERFRYDEKELRSLHHGPAFTNMMNFHYRQATSYFEKAASFIDPAERSRLVASEMMGQVYRELLEKMHRDDFRVFERRYRISKARKATILARSWFSSRFLRPFPADDDDAHSSS